MTNKKTLTLIVAMTFSPFLIAALLSSDYSPHQLSQKNNGKFLTTEVYLENKPSSFNWHLVIQQDNHVGLEKLNNIKIALGKRSDLVDIITVENLSTAAPSTSTAAYIATPTGQLLLSYKQQDIGKPLYKDLKHLLRSNSK
ncbi:hypothetical protein A9R00_07930 [Oleispira antarctica]|uniref:Uncharacterized protein n=1 Tax=Oleispira antarctica TaxID=188908 RepID=A0A1Y5HW26_OLEAN|nr:hypothetical protein A9R00_07930 [Oleispira antarctica]